MIPSRYMVVNERSPYLVKRRVKNLKDNVNEEPAITVLPPQPFTVLSRSDIVRSPFPKIYRTVPPKSAKNKEVSSFVILGDTLQTPVQSRPGSPSGRVSPFRGHGFKSPTTTRPNSRASSPCDFSRNQVSSIKSNNINTKKREKIGYDIGLPPKSPMKKREHVKDHRKEHQFAQTTTSSATSSVTTRDSSCTISTTITESTVTSSTPPIDFTTTKTTTSSVTTESPTSGTEIMRDCEKNENKDEQKSNREEQIIEIGEKASEILQGEKFDKNENSEEIMADEKNFEEKESNTEKNVEENHKNMETTESTTENENDDNNNEKFSEVSISTADTIEAAEKYSNTFGNSDFKKEIPAPLEKLLPAVNLSERKENSVKKQLPVSPLPSKYITNEKLTNSQHQQQQKQSVIKTAAKPPIPPKRTGLKPTLKTENQNEIKKKNGKEFKKNKVGLKQDEKSFAKNGKNSENQVSKNNQKNKTNTNQDIPTKKNDSKLVTETSKIILENKVLSEVQKTAEKIKAEETEKKDVTNKSEVKNNETEKLIPCFQPDKCHIAPPTMASPSPIITPSISTPSTTADLTSSTKNSQSISTAPTTVTSCSMSSVTSTVVLTENLARKEISKARKSILRDGIGSGTVLTNDKSDIVSVEKNENFDKPDAKLISEMVKAGSKDSIKWNSKEKLSEEISSTTKVIKEGPDVEVLSPNSLRNVSLIMPPPNLAWDEERVPNGDLLGKPEKQGKFKTFISAICRFFSYLFCCRCCNSCKCCNKKSSSVPKPSLISRLNCCCNKEKSKEKCTNKGCCGNLFKCCSCKCRKPKCCEGSKCCKKKPKTDVKPKPKKKSKNQSCCAKDFCSCKNCCVRIKAGCEIFREKMNNFCRSLFCLNLMCCQNLLKKCKCCHKLKCCQKGGCCSCCNPYVKREPKKLIKKNSRASTNSRDKNEVDPVLVEHNSIMKAAIPVLPSCLATFCLICNLFIPGFGTFISGLLCLCFGKPRFSTKDSPKNRFKSFIVNTIIGVGQIFTTVFCLVGWGWSIWWGVIMCKLARRQKRIKLAEKSQREAEAAAAAAANVNQNRVDVEQG